MKAEHFTNRAMIAELAAEAQIPTMYAYWDFVQVGGLMAYSIDLPDTLSPPRQYHR
jgi:putative ABC transport system substrate-binding protein